MPEEILQRCTLLNALFTSILNWSDKLLWHNRSLNNLPEQMEKVIFYISNK